MNQIAQNQLEILRRVRDGKHLGRGGVPLASLQDEVDRLLELRLIEPGGTDPYRLTLIGAVVLDAVTRRPTAGERD